MTAPAGVDELVSVEQFEAWTGVPAGTQRSWRHTKPDHAPTSFTLGRRIVYRRSVVEAWIAQQEEASRSA